MASTPVTLLYSPRRSTKGNPLKLIIQIAAGIVLGWLVISGLKIATAGMVLHAVTSKPDKPGAKQAPSVTAPDISMAPVQAAVDDYFDAERQRIQEAENARREKLRGTWTITTESGKTYSNEQPLQDFIRKEPAEGPH